VNPHCCQGEPHCCQGEPDSSGGRTTGGRVPSRVPSRGPRPGSRLRRSLDAGGSELSAVVLILLPKCPACLAAYLAAGAGIGVTLTTASHLRTALLALSLAGLAYLLGRYAVRWVARIQAWPNNRRP
jgi:hypothetical protein